MIYIIIWVILSIIFLFFAILEDKNNRPRAKWFDACIAVLFFWVLLPHFMYEKYNEMRDRQVAKLREEKTK